MLFVLGHSLYGRPHSKDDNASKDTGHELVQEPQTTWDIYASLLRQCLTTQRRFVHAKEVTRAAR